MAGRTAVRLSAAVLFAQGRCLRRSPQAPGVTTLVFCAPLKASTSVGRPYQ
jgi:hypothetical protein